MAKRLNYLQKRIISTKSNNIFNALESSVFARMTALMFAAHSFIPENQAPAAQAGVLVRAASAITIKTITG